MKRIVFLLTIILPCALSGQGIEGYAVGSSLQEVLKPGTHSVAGLGSAASTVGSPYVFGDFVNGFIYFSNNTRSTERMINYDCYDNQVLYRDGEDTYLLDSGMIDYLEFLVDTNSSLIFKKVTVDSRKPPQFLNVLYEDRSILYKRYYKEFRKADAGKAYGSGQRNDEYIDRYDYFVAVDGREIQSLRPRKRNVLELMQDHRDEIEAYLDKERTDLKSDADLVRLLSYYDSLSGGSR